jgi:hypothetical protein
VVAVRKAIELTYDCTCNVLEHQKYLKENKSTGFEDVQVLENQKCKLSFESITNNNQDDVKANVIQSTKLFISPEITIKPGSKIDVTDVMGNTTSYKSSGKPAIYQTHQEIVLELFERWS